MIKLLDLNLCDTPSVLRTFKIVYIILNIAKIIVPLIIIIVGIKDFIGVAINGKDDELKNTMKQMVRRIIAGLVIFFIPSIMNYIFNLNAKYQETATAFTSCSVCLTSGKECDALIASAEIKEEALAANHDSSEDEAQLRKAWEAEQKQKDAKKQSFEEWKKSKQSQTTSNDQNTPTPERHTVSQGKYFDSEDVTKISGLTEEEFVNVLQNSKAYKGKAKVYIPLAHDLILAEKNHGINAFYLIGLYSYESGWLGSTLTKKCNNIGGVRYYHQSYGNGKKTTNCNGGYAGFDSISEFIDFHGNLLETKYLTPGASHYYGTSVANVAKDYGSSRGVDTIIQIATYVSTK